MSEIVKIKPQQSNIAQNRREAAESLRRDQRRRRSGSREGIFVCRMSARLLQGAAREKNGHPALMGSLWAPEELNTKLLGVKAYVASFITEKMS